LWKKRRATPTLFGVLLTRLHALFMASCVVLNVAALLRTRIAHKGWAVVVARFRDSPFLITDLVESITLS